MHNERNTSQEETGVRIGRILDQFISARERGESVSENDLLARHPDVAAELRLHLDLLRDLPPNSDKIEALFSQGKLARSNDSRYPARLGPYKIIDYLGRGGMGIVLKAYEESLGRVVALKILRPELAEDRVALERFTREAKAAAALNHPAIVAVHAVGEHCGTPFIAMEYVDGPSLAEAIMSCRRTKTAAVDDGERPPRAAVATDPRASVASAPRVGHSPEQAPDFPVRSSKHDSPIDMQDADTIRAIFRQLLEALAAAHAAGLIHRDVKSSNILLAMSPRETEPQPLNPEPLIRVKLADFGLARMASSQTRMTAADSLLGTPEYMSPEQARGDADIDYRTDLYSTGVVLYEMLTGQTPFKADTPTGVIHQILNVAPPAPESVNTNVDPVLASIALRLMAKERKQRSESVADILAALSAGICMPCVRSRSRALYWLAAVIVVIASLLTLGLLLITPSPRMLLSEDWEGKSLDPQKWEAWGVPPPAIVVALWGNAHAFNPNGDSNCPSGVNSAEAFDLSKGFRMTWQAITLADMDVRGDHDQGLTVGIVSATSSNDLCGAEGQKQKLAVIQIKAQEPGGKLQVTGAALRNYAYEEPYTPEEDKQWRQYTLTASPDGLLRALRGDNSVIMSDRLKMDLLRECRITIEGRSNGRAGESNIVVDNLELWSQ